MSISVNLVILCSICTFLFFAALPVGIFAVSNSDPLVPVPECSSGQVAVIDATSGLVCKNISMILVEKECPTGEYLAGFDTGEGTHSSNKDLICRPEGAGAGGDNKITIAGCTGSNKYIRSITGGKASCETFASLPDKLCPIGKYLAGFDSGEGGESDDGVLNCRSIDS